MPCATQVRAPVASARAAPFCLVVTPFIEEGAAFGVEADQTAFEGLFATYGYPAGSVPNQTEFGFNTDGTVFTQGDDTPGSVANFRGEIDPLFFNDRFYSYNFAPVNYLQLPLERVSVFARAGFEFSEAAELYAQGLYADYTADSQLAPTATFFGVLMPPTNPFIPPDLQLLLDSREDPSADVVLFKRLSELGPRISSVQYDVYQATLGLRGQVFDGWSYDAYLQIGANDQTDTQSGNALNSRIEELTFAPDGGEAICGGFNPFGLGSISAECAAYIAVDATNRAGVDQTILEASLSGPLLELPAGELRAAFGVFYKKDEYFYSADPVARVFLPDGRPDIIGFNASDDIEGEDDNTDLYVEASIPLLADRPGVRSLEAVVGYRYSDYASAGGADAYKAELLYRPVDALRLRSSYQHAVRAPSVYELYLPQLSVHLHGFDDEPLDPCEADSDRAQRAGPGTGRGAVPGAGLPARAACRITTIADNVARGFAGGNPDLDPETADTLTVRRRAHLAVRQPVARPPAGLARLVPDRDRRCDRHRLLPMNSSRAASTGRSILHSKRRTNGAGCSPAIRRAATSSMPTRSCATARGCGRPGWTCSSTGASISGRVSWASTGSSRTSIHSSSSRRRVFRPWSWLERRDVTRVSSGVHCPSGNGASA